MMEDITDSPITNVYEHENNVSTETNDESKTTDDDIVEINSTGVPPVIQINGELMTEDSLDQEPPIILVQDWDASGRQNIYKSN